MAKLKPCELRIKSAKKYLYDKKKSKFLLLKRKQHLSSGSCPNVQEWETSMCGGSSIGNGSLAAPSGGGKADSQTIIIPLPSISSHTNQFLPSKQHNVRPATTISFCQQRQSNLTTTTTTPTPLDLSQRKEPGPLPLDLSQRKEPGPLPLDLSKKWPLPLDLSRKWPLLLDLSKKGTPVSSSNPTTTPIVFKYSGQEVPMNISRSEINFPVVSASIQEKTSEKKTQLFTDKSKLFFCRRNRQDGPKCKPNEVEREARATALLSRRSTTISDTPQRPPSSDIRTPLSGFGVICPRPDNAYIGLPRKTIEGGAADILLDQLEFNYIERREAVMASDGTLITPLFFLNLLFHRMKLLVHLERFKLRTPIREQFRTEIYAGDFCGVSHAESCGLSEQLAAAHLLDKLINHFDLDSTWKTQRYGLYPGSRLTKMEKTLLDLCQKHCCGMPSYACFNSKATSYSFETNAKWVVSCKVGVFRMDVASDNPKFAHYVAAKNMYMYFTKTQTISDLEIQDYVGVGEDCPSLKNIHPSLEGNSPNTGKRFWMEKRNIFNVDTLLHSSTSTNTSNNLNGKPYLKSRVKEFRQRILTAAKWIDEIRLCGGFNWDSIQRDSDAGRQYGRNIRVGWENAHPKNRTGNIIFEYCFNDRE